MTIENAWAFLLNASKDSDLEQQVTELKDRDPDTAIDELVRLGGEYSQPFTREELLAVLKDINAADSGELSDRALETVSGGSLSAWMSRTASDGMKATKDLADKIAGGMLFMR